MKQPFCCLLLTLLSCCACAYIGPNTLTKESVSATAIEPWQPTVQQKQALTEFANKQVKPATADLTLLSSGQKISLAQLVTIGLSQNPATSQAWENARAAAYQLNAAHSQNYPQLNFQTNLAAIDQTPLVPGQPAYARTLTPQINLDYLLLDFGRTNTSICAARQALFAANWAHDQTIQDVLVQILRAYYQYASSEAIVEAKRADLHDGQITLETTQNLFTAGLLTQTDFLQAQSTLAKLQLDLEIVLTHNKLQFCQLTHALGLATPVQFEIEPLPVQTPLEDQYLGEVDQLLIIAQKHRPDLLQAQAVVQQKSAEMQAAKVAGLPVFNANAMAARSRYFNHKAPTAHSYSAGIGFSIPLFDGFMLQSQYAKAKSLQSAAQAAWENKQTAVYLDVVSSHTSLKSSLQRQKYSQLYLHYTHETYQSVLLSYKQGLKSILDLLSAQSALSEARAEQIEAHTNVFASFASLSYALGILDSTTVASGNSLIELLLAR